MPNNYNVMEFDSFLRSQSLQTRKVSFFLGAGASIESGILSATQCILEWKKMIYDSNNPNSSFRYADFKAENCILEVQKWIDSQKKYPALNSDMEYSYFAEAAIQDDNDRCAYFNAKIQEAKNPSVGYKLLAFMAKQGYLDRIWTTNFDDLVQRAMSEQNIPTIEVSLDCKERVYLPIAKNNIMIIKLHGDYKYSKMKNTSKELDTQESIFVEALKHSLKDTDLIVIGYSGRDSSVMTAIEKAYSEKGCGRLFWLGYERNANACVEKLLSKICNNGRKAYYVPSNGFDSIMFDITDIKYGTNERLKSEYRQLIAKESINLTKDFVESSGKIGKVVSTNCYLLKCPNVFYQFDITRKESENWVEINELVKKLPDAVIDRCGCTAFFLGNKDSVQNIFKRNLTISSIPFDKTVIKQRIILRLIKAALLKVIVYNNADLETDGRKYIWDKTTKKINDANYVSYEGIEIKIFKNNKIEAYNYMSILPKCYVEKESRDNTSNWDKLIVKKISDRFYAKINYVENKSKPNFGTYNYIELWHNRINHNSKQYKVCFGGNEEMCFIIGERTALVGVVHNGNTDLSNNKRVVFCGEEYKDPELTFYSTRKNDLVVDRHPMRGLIENAPFEKKYAPNGVDGEVNISVVLPKGEKEKFANFINQLNSSHDVIWNTNYVLQYPGFYNIYKLPLAIPATNSNSWREFPVPDCKTEIACKKMANSITEAINFVESANPGSIVLIYIPKELEYFEGYTNEKEKFDLHDYVKAYTIPKNISTQFIREKTLDYTDFTSVFWTLSLALYVKSGRIPWTIKQVTYENSTAYVGLGYSVDAENIENPIVLGCSHIFAADGQSIKYRLSKVRNPQFDVRDKYRENPYLTENEAYKLGCSINDMFRKSFSKYPQRVVVHKRTPFKQDEINGLVKSLSLYGVNDIDLLTITYEDNLRTFELNQDKPFDYPVKRGLGFVVDKATMYLYTHGVAMLGKIRYVMGGGRNIPAPLKITKYYGNSSAFTVANDILGLTRMNWNNFNLYSKLPCTIESSNNIARIGYLLSAYDGEEYDYRLFI